MELSRYSCSTVVIMPNEYGAVICNSHMMAEACDLATGVRDYVMSLQLQQATY